MTRVVIIGAGLSGLSAAYHLEKKGFTDFCIVEKELYPGGLCRSINQDNFTFDYTGHLLHSSDPYFSSFLHQIIETDTLKTVQRKSFIYSHQTYTPYPYQINLHGLPVETVIDCIEGYVKRSSLIRQPKSFSKWVLKYFGHGFAKSFFFPYQRKLLRYDPKKLAASWTGRFVPKTSLHHMLYGALCRDTKKVGYNALFLYPRVGGIQFLIDQILKKIHKSINTNKTVVAIDLRNKVITFENGETEQFDIIINTMPLDQLLCCLRDRPATRLKSARRNLICTSVACLNLGISSALGNNKHWIYYPEKRYPFYRLGFYHNFSSACAPSGCSSLYVECSYRDKSELQVKHLFKTAQLYVQDLFGISADDILVKNMLSIAHAYVVYDFWREKNLQPLLERLEEEGIYSIGRYGAWKYSSMQEAVLDGKRAAEMITLQPAQPFVSTYFQQKSKKREDHRRVHIIKEM